MFCICYKTIVPVVYNKGTVYEKSCDDFLLHYCLNEKNAIKEAEELNKKHPKKDFLGGSLDWAKIKYVYVDKQNNIF